MSFLSGASSSFVDGFLADANLVGSRKRIADPQYYGTTSPKRFFDAQEGMADRVMIESAPVRGNDVSYRAPRNALSGNDFMEELARAFIPVGETGGSAAVGLGKNNLFEREFMGAQGGIVPPVHQSFFPFAGARPLVIDDMGTNSNANASNAMLTSTVFVEPTVYRAHPEFGTAKSPCEEVDRLFLMKECVENREGVMESNVKEHLRSIDELNRLFALYPIQYKDWKALGKNGMPPGCLFPLRNKDTDKIEYSKERYYAPIGISISNIDPNSVMTVVRRGTIHNLPNYFLSRFEVAHTGKHVFLLYTLRVKDDAAAQQEKEYTGEQYAIEDTKLVHPRLEFYLSDERFVPAHVYTTRHCIGSCRYVGQIQHNSFAQACEQKCRMADRAASCVYGEDDNVIAFAQTLNSLPRVRFYLEL
jgi:hypothetical protein